MNLGKMIKKLIKGILWCFVIIIVVSIFCGVMLDDEDQQSSVEPEQQKQETQEVTAGESSEERQETKAEDAESAHEEHTDEYVNPTDSGEQSKQVEEDARYTPFGSDDPKAIWLGNSYGLSKTDDPDAHCDIVLENVRHEVREINEGLDGDTLEYVYSYRHYIFLDFDITNTSKSSAIFSFGQGNDCVVSDGYVDEGMQIDGEDMITLADMDFGRKELAPGLKLKYTAVFKLDDDMWNHKEIYYQFNSGSRFYLMKDGVITPSIPME